MSGVLAMAGMFWIGGGTAVLLVVWKAVANRYADLCGRAALSAFVILTWPFWVWLARKGMG